MKFILADERDTRNLRRTDVRLVRIVGDAEALWIWSGSLKHTNSAEELYLFNTEPPVGSMAVNLGRLNREWCYEGLALFVLPSVTFERNLGAVATSQVGCALSAGQTLRAAVDDAVKAEPVDFDRLFAITGLASSDAGRLRSIASLRAHLDAIIVPQVQDPSAPPTRTARAQEAADKLSAVRRLSVWTPGTSEVDFTAFYTPLVGDAEAKRLWAINRAAIAAVAGGHFEKQVELGDELAKLVPENSVLAGEAAYFRAEGLRLLGDLEPEPRRRAELRADAVTEYERAAEFLKDDPRPLRGLGRITELRGDFDGALNFLQHARGLCLTETYGASTVPRLDLAHEVLRTTRHFIHCLLDIRATNPASAWHRVDKERELEGYLQVCENLHHEYMPTFRGEPEWYYIEWFMGFVFLAKAWGALGRHTKAQAALTMALEARRNIMRQTGPITAIERANLEWWISVARGQGYVLEPDFIQRVERLDAALKRGESLSVATAIADVLRPFATPWGAIGDASEPKGSCKGG